MVLNSHIALNSFLVFGFLVFCGVVFFVCLFVLAKKGFSDCIINRDTSTSSLLFLDCFLFLWFVLLNYTTYWFSTMLNKNDKTGHLDFLLLWRSFSVFTIECELGCRLVGYDFYYIEIPSVHTRLAESFCHETILTLFKVCYCIYSDHMALFFILFVSWFSFINLYILNCQCILRDKSKWIIFQSYMTLLGDLNCAH